MKKFALVMSVLALMSVSCKNAKWPWSPSAEPAETVQGDSSDGETRTGGTYSVQGVLSESQVYVGGLNSPRRYLVRDPQTQEIKAYAESSKGTVDLGRYVGKQVKITGPVGDKVFGLLVEAETVIELTPETVELKAPSAGS